LAPVSSGDCRTMEDSSLVRSLQEGDREAYKQIFLTYYSPLCEYATRFIPDADAEELVQSLMMYLWENREELVIESSLRSYLFTATRHRCLNAIKKNSSITNRSMDCSMKS